MLGIRCPGRHALPLTPPQRHRPPRALQSRESGFVPGVTAAHHNIARPPILLASTSPQQCVGRSVSSKPTRRPCSRPWNGAKSSSGDPSREGPMVRICLPPAKSLLRTLNLRLSQSRGSPSETPPRPGVLSVLTIRFGPRTAAVTYSRARWAGGQCYDRPLLPHSGLPRPDSSPLRDTHLPLELPMKGSSSSKMRRRRDPPMASSPGPGFSRGAGWRRKRVSNSQSPARYPEYRSVVHQQTNSRL